MASRANALRAWSAAVVDGGDDSLAGVASRLLERTVHDTASIAAALRAGATAVAARRLRMALALAGLKALQPARSSRIDLELSATVTYVFI